MNDQKLEEALSGLPLYIYAWGEPESLEFSDRVRWICQHECAMYGTTWACPPAFRPEWHIWGRWRRPRWREYRALPPGNGEYLPPGPSRPHGLPGWPESPANR